MAGILANSATVSMTSGSPDASQAGFLTGERVVLSATPTGSLYSWGIAVPNGSAAGRSSLSDDTDNNPTFTPDVAGYYVITVNVDGTTYVLRLAVTNTAVSYVTQAMRLSPVRDEQVEAPSVGLALYYSSTQGALCVKNPTDHVFTVNLTAV